MCKLNTFIIAVSILFLVWTQSAYTVEPNSEQEGCQTVDLRSEFESLGIGVRNQGPSENCFAYAAADLISFKIKKVVSARSLAFHYHNNLKPFRLIWLVNLLKKGSKMRGGFVKDTIETAKRVGYCLENEVPSEFLTDEIHIYEALSILEDDIASMKSRDLMCEDQKELISHLYPALNLASDVTKALFLSLQRKMDCSRRILDPSLNILSKLRLKDRQKFIPEIDDLLNSAHPVSISFRGDALFAVDNPNPKLSVNSHISLVIGRRFNNTNGICEYLIRNSWGNNCEKINSHNKRTVCENGYIWMPRTSLGKVVTGTTWIE